MEGWREGRGVGVSRGIGVEGGGTMHHFKKKERKELLKMRQSYRKIKKRREQSCHDLTVVLRPTLFASLKLMTTVC